MSEIIKREDLNIQPNAGILSVFSRLNYKPWYAIGEFVDNSTASFFGHQPTLKFYKINKMRVSVEYDSFKNTLTIIDDAFGMEIDDFKRAVLMDQEPDHLNGRNEFGMGLKTAASWFGNVWSVESTQLGSFNRYYAKVDIPKLKKEGLNKTEIVTTTANKFEHGTTIIISDITKKIDSASTKTKIEELLSSMYRRDIKNGEVEIFFNGKRLFFEPYEILTFRNNEWKRDVDFTFAFNDKEYHVTGFVGIMAKGSFPKAGFALFRYNRVIMGGFDENYKPKDIFVQAQSQISLKLFGELNMEDFPVNQAKDGFVWDDGLEEEFVKNLKQNIKDYIEIAKLSKDDRAKEEEINQDSSDETESKVAPLFEGTVLDDEDSVIKQVEQNPFLCSLAKKYKEEQKEIEETAPEAVSKVRNYSIQLDAVTTRTFKVCWKITSNDKWIDYNPETFEIFININHPFFKPYSRDPEFKNVLESFVVSFICAEELAKNASLSEGDEGKYILPSVFRNKMNLILKKLSENKKD